MGTPTVEGLNKPLQLQQLVFMNNKHQIELNTVKTSL